jgi:hypothetical protein
MGNDVGSKVHLIVIHVEDEPWDHTYMFLELREIVTARIDRLGRGECELTIGSMSPGSFPSLSRLKWEEGDVQYCLSYWLVESRIQLATDIKHFQKDLANADTFIIDVVGNDDKSSGVSVWRESIAALVSMRPIHSRDICLYSAFGKEEEWREWDMGSEPPNGTESITPAYIQKGDTKIYDFVLRALKGTPGP